MRPLELVDCTFFGNIDLRYCVFHATVDFSSSSFLGRLNCGDETRSKSQFYKDVIFDRSTFLGPVGFNGAEVKGSVYFSDSRFLLGTDEEIPGAPDYAKDPDYTGNRDDPCQRSHSTPLSAETDFTGLVCTQLDCSNALFRGGVSFNHIKCDGLFLSWAKFHHPSKLIDFKLARIGVLSAICAEFAGPVRFHKLNCGADAQFNQSKFLYVRTINDRRAILTEVDFRYSEFRYDLRLERCTVNGSIDLGQSRIGQKLYLAGASFESDLKLYDSRIGTIVLRSRGVPTDTTGDPKRVASGLSPFGSQCRLDLNGCRFAQLHGSDKTDVEWEFARLLLSTQDPKKFSRDPYLQLESYYRNSGDQRRADDIRYLGHRNTVQNASRPFFGKPEGAIKLSRGQWLRELTLGIFTGWGLRKLRIIFICAMIVSLGAFFFSKSGWVISQSGLSPAESLTPTIRLGNFTHPNHNSDPSISAMLLYSLDVFLPLVALGYDDNWKPAQASAEIYYAVHTVLGWLLVPLAVGAITGLIESKN